MGPAGAGQRAAAAPTSPAVPSRAPLPVIPAPGHRAAVAAPGVHARRRCGRRRQCRGGPADRPAPGRRQPRRTGPDRGQRRPDHGHGRGVRGGLPRRGRVPHRMDQSRVPEPRASRGPRTAVHAKAGPSVGGSSPSSTWCDRSRSWTTSGGPPVRTDGDDDWHRRKVTPLLHVWWGLWIFGGLLSLSSADDADLSSAKSSAIAACVADGVLIIACALAIVVITRLTESQELPRHRERTRAVGGLGTRRLGRPSPRGRSFRFRLRRLRRRRQRIG